MIPKRPRHNIDKKNLENHLSVVSSEKTQSIEVIKVIIAEAAKISATKSDKSIFVVSFILLFFVNKMQYTMYF